MQGRIINVGFSYLTDQHVDALLRAGILRSCVIQDRKTLLPFIDKDCSPEQVRSVVKETIQDLDLTESDILIISGMPDICIYIREIVPYPGPVLLVPIGEQSVTGFKLHAFREVLNMKSPNPPLHILAYNN